MKDIAKFQYRAMLKDKIDLIEKASEADFRNLVKDHINFVSNKFVGKETPFRLSRLVMDVQMHEIENIDISTVSIIRSIMPDELFNSVINSKLTCDFLCSYMANGCSIQLVCADKRVDLSNEIDLDSIDLLDRYFTQIDNNIN